MQSPIREIPSRRSLRGALFAIVSILGLDGWAGAATPLQIWGPAGPITKLSPADGGQFPPELAPAFRFQLLFGKILSGAPSAEWSPELEEILSVPVTDPVSSGIHDAALVWLARVRMEQIDAILLDYYTHNIHFPKSDAEFQRLLPPQLAKDPWGEPWVYSPQKPQGFSDEMNAQRYKLGPSHAPELSPMAVAIKRREPMTIISQIAPRDIAERHALEFRSPKSVSVIEPGGKVESSTLLYVGDHWALMGRGDQIFAVAF